jgi:hypothetical protein
MNSNKFFVRFVSVCVSLVVMAGLWDTWWHVAVGRDSFWVPPHILLFLGMGSAILVAAYMWFVRKNAAWKWLFLALLLIPLSGPFDEAWHRAYGVENLSSASVVWSPPHLLLILGIFLSILAVLKLVRNDPETYIHSFFGDLLYASIGAILFVLVIPWNPLGPYHVLGFWGAGFYIFPFLLMLFSREAWEKEIGSLAYTAAFFLLMIGLGTIFNEKIAPGIIINAREYPPAWISIASFMLPTFWFELSRYELGIFRGAVAGCIFAIFYFALAALFLSPHFQPTQTDIFVALLSSTIGGAASGFIALYFKK